MSTDEPTNLDWVQLRQEMTARHPMETARQKFGRKFTANPFVPIGCLATVTALSYGLWSFRKRNSVMSQRMMRYRILAQGFTIVAIISGVIMASNTPNTPNDEFEE